MALVKNASGDYTSPSPVDVASALAYATQLPNGTHQLDFGGIGPHVYNPSTYSYLLTPTTGWSPSKGDTLSQYVNYSLTLGQQKAPSFQYASLGLSLEQYGIKTVQANVPGAVAPTAAESQAYSCGDLTPTEVQAGQTTPTCGVTQYGCDAGTAGGECRHGGGGSGDRGLQGRRGGALEPAASGGAAAVRVGQRRRPRGRLDWRALHGGHRHRCHPARHLRYELFLVGFVGRRRILKRRLHGAP